MASDGRVRIGLVGLGRMGRFHAANLAGRIPRVELTRIIDADEGLGCTGGCGHQSSGALFAHPVAAS